MVVSAWNDGRNAGIHQNFKGIVFMGTPHRSAKLANLLKMILKGNICETTIRKSIGPSIRDY
jgi:hypothetical protein